MGIPEAVKILMRATISVPISSSGRDSNRGGDSDSDSDRADLKEVYCLHKNTGCTEVRIGRLDSVSDLCVVSVAMDEESTSLSNSRSRRIARGLEPCRNGHGII